MIGGVRQTVPAGRGGRDGVATRSTADPWLRYAAAGRRSRGGDTATGVEATNPARGWPARDDALTFALDELGKCPRSPRTSIGVGAGRVGDPQARYPQTGVASVSVPTWYFGHEPPNVFSSGIAKFFSNAIREDVLLRGATRGVIVLPGAAGTVQEIFQLVTGSILRRRAGAGGAARAGRPGLLTFTLPVWLLLAGAGRRPCDAGADRPGRHPWRRRGRARLPQRRTCSCRGPP